MRLYDLRHTAATLALAAGVPAKVVSEQLGHASAAFTLDTYAHVLPHMQDEAAAKFETLLFERQSPKPRHAPGRRMPPHYALMPAQFRAHFKSYSYRIQTPHGVVVFTGDTGTNDAVVKLAMGADVLVSEVEESLNELRVFIDRMAALNHWPPARKQEFAAHMEKEHLTVDSLGELASKAQVHSVLFYHYDPENKAEQEARIADVKKYFHGPVLAPMDLDRFCLSKDEGESEKAKFESCGQKTGDQE